MRSILLVRHAEPHVVPHQKASTWSLTDAGRAKAWEIAASLVDDHPDIVVTSQERKARETGEVIACALGLTVREHEGLGEQGGDSVEFISNQDVFRETVRQHFGESSRILLGQRSATKAGARFASVVADLSDQVSPPRCPILVSRGRVMASFLALATGVDAWTIWNDFMMPDAIAVDLDSSTIHRLVIGNRVPWLDSA